MAQIDRYVNPESTAGGDGTTTAITGDRGRPRDPAHRIRSGKRPGRGGPGNASIDPAS